MHALLPEFSFENAFARGWDMFKGWYGLVLGAVLIMIAIAVVLGVLGWICEQELGFDPIGLVDSIFISPVIHAGLVLLMARLARREAPGVGGVFEGFGQYWRVVLTNLALLGCMIGVGLLMLPGALLMVLGSPDIGMVVLVIGAIVFIPLAIFLQARLGFAGTVAIDPAMACTGAGDALRKSWRMTENHWLPLIGLYIVLGLIAVASALLLVLPLVFFGLPLMFATLGAAYAQMAQRLTGGVCTLCGYDLSGAVDDRCPECGHRPDTGPLGPAMA